MGAKLRNVLFATVLHGEHSIGAPRVMLFPTWAVRCQRVGNLASHDDSTTTTYLWNQQHDDGIAMFLSNYQADDGMTIFESLFD